jgi:hypothetical protein
LIGPDGQLCACATSGAANGAAAAPINKFRLVNFATSRSPNVFLDFRILAQPIKLQ